MSRLDFKTKDRAQVVVEGLYQDLETYHSQPTGTVPGRYGRIVFEAVPRTIVRQMCAVQSGHRTAFEDFR